jgi:hypothetical protein
MDRITLDDLQKRIENLEARHRTWRRIGLAAIVLAAFLFMYNAFGYAQAPAVKPLPAPKAEKAAGAQVSIDETAMKTTYVNFFRVTGNPDEVILDLGFYSQIATPGGTEPVKITDRAVMNFYTAKKFQLTLQEIVKRHEDAFGELQTDPAKRLRPRKED